MAATEPLVSVGLCRPRTFSWIESNSEAQEINTLSMVMVLESFLGKQTGKSILP